MWTVGDKPTLAEAIHDIDPLVDHCRSLDDSHKLLLNKLYKEYNVKGYATDLELRALNSVKAAIKGQYKTKMMGGQPLCYVRQELMAKVTHCPMCSINETHQLDHFMDESTYGQLACCRLNLVPVCGVCNRLKHDDTYTEYVHAYYDNYQGVIFFVTTITIKNNRLGMIFSIDRAAIGAPNLERRTIAQFDHLELNKRLHKAGIMFVNDMIGGMMCSTDKELHDSLLSKQNDCMTRYGLNDWRTSIIRGLLANTAFNINVFNAMKAPMNIRPINGGSA